MTTFTIKTNNDTFTIETESGVYLAYKKDGITIINADTVKKHIKERNSHQLAELGKYVEADRLVFEELTEEYTILADDDGAYEGNNSYMLFFGDGKAHLIMGDFIVARLDSQGNAIPLTEEDVAILHAKLSIYCSRD
ncbi:MAG: hypothetical protein KBT36_01495 [Kurthia sp.]|nr:hypothetical protein [Candidatus Kurthia equi]